MKINILIASVILLITTGCDNKETFVDLETGKTITVVKDSATGYMVNAETKDPLGIYVNTATKDTFYGRTGELINNRLVLTPSGRYTFQDGRTKEKIVNDDENDSNGDGDYKKKVEKDGDIKIKDGNTKIKIEDDGEKKIKKDND